jgi:uncharacterized cofD-like protein
LVAVGGGTGLAVLLRGLKHRVGHELGDLKAVVTMADDGGSSGRLRRELGVLPPGDVRNCIVALANDEDLLARLFQYRFATGSGLSGHSFGNLFLTALTGITGDFYQAILTAEAILSVRGKILPSTLADVHLFAEGASGKRYDGESQVGLSGEPLEAVRLEPPAVAPFPPALEAIRGADLILLGPGSLYTSILPNLLIPGIRRALTESQAPVVLVMNLMTQPGETDDMDALAHFDAIHRHAGVDLVDRVLLNTAPLPESAVSYYSDAGATPVRIDRAALAERGVEIVGADLLAHGELIRHDSRKLAESLVQMIATEPAGRGF